MGDNNRMHGRTMNGGASPEEIAEKYAGKSEDELMRELMSVTAKQKQEGSFDAEGMRKTAERLMPMLNKEQARKLRSIISALGSGDGE